MEHKSMCLLLKVFMQNKVEKKSSRMAGKKVDRDQLSYLNASAADSLADIVV